MNTVVEARHLQKRYGEFEAVTDVSFAVTEGEIFGILGPNGAGKTTTVECLQGLRRADDGDLRVLGFDPRHEADQLRRMIGSQLQESALPERLKVWEALKLFSSRHKGGPPWEMILDEWGLAEKRNATFGSLSGGQQQRLFVALAVVNAPKLVFLDEMTTGLDPMSRRLTWELIRKIRAQGTTVLLVTHFMDEAEHLCDRIAVIDRRQVVAVDTVDGLIGRFGGASRVQFSTDITDVSFIDSVAGVEGFEQSGRRVAVTGTGPVMARVAAALAERNEFPVDLEVSRPTLEDVFLAITGGGA